MAGHQKFRVLRAELECDVRAAMSPTQAAYAMRDSISSAGLHKATLYIDGFFAQQVHEQDAPSPADLPVTTDDLQDARFVVRPNC